MVLGRRLPGEPVLQRQLKLRMAIRLFARAELDYSDCRTATAPSAKVGSLIARNRKLLNDVSEAFWVIPGLMVLAGVVAAYVFVRIDHIGAQADPLLEEAWLYRGGPAGARAVLAAIASSTIAVAGTVFSITIAALSLASGQMGPRLLRNFTRDRGNQITLGAFIGTFVYALMVLRTVRQPARARVRSAPIADRRHPARLRLRGNARLVRRPHGAAHQRRHRHRPRELRRSRRHRSHDGARQPAAPASSRVLARRDPDHRSPQRISAAARRGQSRRLGLPAPRRAAAVGAAGRLRVSQYADRDHQAAYRGRRRCHSQVDGARRATARRHRSRLYRRADGRGRGTGVGERGQRSADRHQRPRPPRRGAVQAVRRAACQTASLRATTGRCWSSR